MIWAAKVQSRTALKETPLSMAKGSKKAAKSRPQEKQLTASATAASAGRPVVLEEEPRVRSTIYKKRLERNSPRDDSPTKRATAFEMSVLLRCRHTFSSTDDKGRSSPSWLSTRSLVADIVSYIP
jgi:hypothetical protein